MKAAAHSMNSRRIGSAFGVEIAPGEEGIAVPGYQSVETPGLRWFIIPAAAKTPSMKATKATPPATAKKWP